jgi:hypothetical protein
MVCWASLSDEVQGAAGGFCLPGALADRTRPNRIPPPNIDLTTTGDSPWRIDSLDRDFNHDG